jgi:hypothetical protein
MNTSGHIRQHGSYDREGLQGSWLESSRSPPETLSLMWCSFQAWTWCAMRLAGVTALIAPTCVFVRSLCLCVCVCGGGEGELNKIFTPIRCAGILSRQLKNSNLSSVQPQFDPTPLPD